MNTSLSVDLLLYGITLIGLSVLAHHFSFQVAAATLWVGIAGGALSVFFGVLGLRRYPVRLWAIMTMAVLSIILFGQVVVGWLAVKAGVETAKSAALILTVLCVLAVGQWVNLVQGGRGLPFNADTESRNSEEKRK
jgi:hypothetical protein